MADDGASLSPFRRQILASGATAGLLGLNGCLRLISGNQSEGTPTAWEAPNAPFTFQYDSDALSVTVQYTGGESFTARDLEFRTLNGTTATWPAIGSTSVSPTEVLSSGATATLGADVDNWGTPIQRTTVLKLVYISEDGSPTTLATYRPDESASTTVKTEEKEQTSETEEPTTEETETEDTPPKDETPGVWSMFGQRAAQTNFNPEASGPLSSSVEPVWEFTTDDDVQATRMAIDDEKAYVPSLDGNLYAIDTTTGEKAWSVDVSGFANAGPAVVDGVVFTSADGVTYALDAETGDSIWTASVGDPLCNVTVKDGVVYVVQDRAGTIYAIDSSTGETNWTSNEDGYKRTVCVGSSYLYAPRGRSGVIHAVDPTDGSVAWSFEAGGWVFQPPSVSDGRVYSNPKGAPIRALDSESGEVVWKSDENGSEGVVAVADGTAYALTQAGFTAYDATGGERRWNRSISVGSVPAVSTDAVFVGGGGRILALDRESGETIWKYSVGNTSRTAPAVYGNAIYFGDYSGSVYKLQ